MRERIDCIDKQIVALYEERMKISEEVGRYKLETGKKVFDKERENEKLASVELLASSGLNKVGIRELYEHIMSVSRKLQYRLLAEHHAIEQSTFTQIEALESKNAKVVFQGVEGAYSQMALHKYFGEDIKTISVETFKDAMKSIEEGQADYAVLPIENSSAGPVTQVYDLLVNFENYIVGEISLPIEHTLAVLPGTKLSDIVRVYSHPQALMQSEKFLDAHRKMEQISVANTAVAAQQVLADADKTQAAICSAGAAKLYGLEILENKTNHNDNNTTRFIVITNRKVFVEGANKISICFEIPHESGSLYRLLSNFIYNDLNMTKIESRPIEGRTWEYRFFIDFEGDMESASVKNALIGVQEEAKNLQILGNY
ncbi:MAG: prephenate dehydratase [Eubacteriales bacterium]